MPRGRHSTHRTYLIFTKKQENKSYGGKNNPLLQTFKLRFNDEDMKSYLLYTTQQVNDTWGLKSGDEQGVWGCGGEVFQAQQRYSDSDTTRLLMLL